MSKSQDKAPDLRAKYWEGDRNKVIRYYYYSQRGLALFNEFRYVFMLIFGVYLTFKLQNPFWLAGMFIVSLPILIGIGWLAVHHVSKVVDWLNIEFATHWGRYGFDLQEQQNKILREIHHQLVKAKAKPRGRPRKI